MKINAKIIHSKDNVDDWNRLADDLIKLDHGSREGMKGPELLPGLKAKLIELRDTPIENDHRFIELVRWLVQQAEAKSSAKTAEARAKDKQPADEAKRLLGHLKNLQLLGSELTKEERNHFKNFIDPLNTQANLMLFASQLHNEGTEKKTIGELSETVFSWHKVANGNKQEEKLFIDSLAILALRQRADKDRNKVNNDINKVDRHLQVNWLLIAAQTALFIGNGKNAEVAIEELEKLADSAKRDKAYRHAKTLRDILAQLNGFRQADPNHILTPAETRSLALENSKNTYYKRAHGDPRRPAAGVYIFFTCLAILALVFGVGVFVASHGAAALLLAPAGHALLSLLGVTTKVAADALAFSLLSLIPLSIFAISMEAAFPRGGLGRFFSFIFKNKAANHKIQALSPFHLNSSDFRIDGKAVHEDKQITLWAALNARPFVTPLKVLFYPITYLVGIVLAIVSPESKATSTKSKDKEKQRLLDNDKGKEHADIETSSDWDKLGKLLENSKDKAFGKGKLFKDIKKVYEEILEKAKTDPSNFSPIRLKSEVSAALCDIHKPIHKRQRDNEGTKFFKPGARSKEALGYLNLLSHINDEPKSSSSSSSSTTTPHV